MADIRDVAQRAGCSIATVSRALNSPHLVRPETLARVQAAATELKFRPNALGRQLRGERTGLIGVMLPTLGNPVFADCLEGIEAAIDGTGRRLLLVTTQYDPERERNAIETLLQQRVDGLLLTLADAEHSALVDDLAAEGVACQLVYNDAPERPCVSVDNRAAAAQGVTMLIDAGHRDIVMVTGALHASDRAKRRYLGYGDAMQAAGLTPLPAFEIDFNSGARGERVREWLAQRERDGARPTALFCSNDLLALGVMRALREAGLRVPDDISVLGFDGLAVGELLSPTLATVVQPSVDIGRHAAQRLLAQIDARTGTSGTSGAGGAGAVGASHDPSLEHALILPHEIRRGGTVAAPPRKQDRNVF